MHVDKANDTITSFTERIASKFNINPLACGMLVGRLFLMPTGEIIDDVGLIEKNDKIEVEVIDVT